jgi:hypothetical protein
MLVPPPPSNEKIITRNVFKGGKAGDKELGSAYKWYTDLAINTNIKVTKKDLTDSLLPTKGPILALWDDVTGSNVSDNRTAPIFSEAQED